MDTKNKQFGPTRIIALGFLIIILIGTFLLKLPISHVKDISTFDALFVATSATCVTGLSTVTLTETFTAFGQFIIMCLIQIGGLGFMLIVALILSILGKKITLKNRMLISQTISTDSMQGLVNLTKRIFKYTITFEILGAILIATTFVPIYGWGAGLFKSIFQSISAFCNAGFDLVGANSLIPFATYKILNITCMALTVLGGLGFLVWDDIAKTFAKGIHKKMRLGRIVSRLTLHTKLVLILTIILILFGAISFLSFEYTNTLAEYNLGDKVLISFFQSISSRTAGFATVDMANINEISKVLIIFLMFIGAGAGSVAGGIKITTFMVVLLGVVTSIIGKKNISIMKKTISSNTFLKAVTVFMIALFAIMISMIILLANSNVDTLDILFETVSAFATVGFTSGALATMNLLCKAIIVLLMYIGRIGTITMAVAFVMKKPKENDLIVYPEENVIVG